MKPVPAGTIPSLDGIRALAVVLVFMAHSGLENFVPGGLGVTVFFVLSGYLISTLMRIEHARTGRIDLARFWGRRLLRLMPPLLLVVALAGALSALSVIGGGFSRGGLIAALLYAGNYHVIANDFHGLPEGLGLIWSLAIEEHFYLLYPPLALLLLRAPAARAAGALALACAAVLAWRAWLWTHGASVDYLTMASDTRVDAILFGCLMALWRNPWLGPVPALGARRSWAVAATAVAALLATLLIRNEAFRLTLRFTLQGPAIAALIWLAVAQSGQRPWCWLNLPPLVYLGTVSYTVYLTHHLILLGLARHYPDAGWAALTLVGALLTLALAEAMRRWVEQPCAALRRRLRGPPPAPRAAPGLDLAGTP